jgi:phospholipid/cholesterol/gamma-HCH transport system ATP-binding protein
MISVSSLYLSFNGEPVLENISFEIPSGKTGVILGKNGTGKSVLLKCIAGLIPHQKGSIVIGERQSIDMTESPFPYYGRMPLAYVFQKGGLFDSMNVFDNIAFGMRRIGIPEKEVESKTMSTLERVGLSGNEGKLPSELSGGMQKRVGLARALCLEPQVILYDDPTAGLDPILTDSIADLILEIRNSTAVTSLVVTHDLKFAGKIADFMFLLYRGCFVFAGSRDEFFSESNSFSSRFIRGESEFSAEEI